MKFVSSFNLALFLPLSTSAFFVQLPYTTQRVTAQQLHHPVYHTDTHLDSTTKPLSQASEFLFDDYFDDFLNSFPFFTSSDKLVPSFIRSNAMIRKRFTSPRYEVHEDDDLFQLSIDLPGIKKEDLNVELKNDGRLLQVTGHRKVEDDKYRTKTKFDKMFSIRRISLHDGVLHITAPKFLPEDVLEHVKKFAIMDGPPTKEIETDKKEELKP